MYLTNNNLVAAYVRLSNDEVLQHTSIENQIEIITDYCNSHNLKLIRIYSDEGYTGSTFNRPEFKRMLIDLDAKIVNCVVTKDVSRLGRNLLQVGRYIDEYFINNNIRYISIMDNYDSSIATQDESMGLKLFLNDYYIKECSKKGLIRSKNESVKINMTKLGVYGYLKDSNNQVIIDKATAPIVKEIFTRYEAGESTKDISDDLNERKIPSPLAYKKQRGYYLNRVVDDKGDIWTKSKVYDILKIGQYTGDAYNLINAHKKTDLSYKRHKPVIVLNTHEAIISRELFNKVQMIRMSKRKRNDYSSKSNIKKLSKILYCPICNKAYVLNYSHKSGRYVDRTCKCSISKNLIEDILYRQALKWINKSKVNYKKFKDKVKVVKKEETNYEALLDEIKKGKVDITKRSDMLFEAYAMEEISKEDYTLKQEILNDDLKSLEEKENEVKLLKIKDDRLSKEISDFLMEIFQLNIKKIDKVDVIKKIIEKVIITKINDEIIFKEIKYKFAL